MQPLNYEELQKAPIDIQRQVYGWLIKIGPLMIRPDGQDRTRRRVINYYWRHHWIFTSARRYIILHVNERRIIIGYYRGAIRIKEDLRATA